MSDDDRRRPVGLLADAVDSTWVEPSLTLPRRRGGVERLKGLRGNVNDRPLPFELDRLGGYAEKTGSSGVLTGIAMAGLGLSPLGVVLPDADGIAPAAKYDPGMGYCESERDDRRLEETSRRASTSSDEFPSTSWSSSGGSGDSRGAGVGTAD